MKKANHIKLEPIEYSSLKSKAQENYNFLKMAAILADYGYNCLWLNDDWNDADCIAMHIDGISDFKIQLKGGISFAQKYRGKNLFIAFFELGDLYIYPHDVVLDQVKSVISDQTWLAKGTYFQTKITKKFSETIAPYKVTNVR